MLYATAVVEPGDDSGIATTELLPALDLLHPWGVKLAAVAPGGGSEPKPSWVMFH
ncbi:unnamed protein product [marine sediment metagenome]|uniref:Uncharacterized protein n=1 Tax=marine sediment metagenome TaxID=412755 RepID=X0UX23_9ZZZZ